MTPRSELQFVILKNGFVLVHLVKETTGRHDNLVNK